MGTLKSRGLMVLSTGLWALPADRRPVGISHRSAISSTRGAACQAAQRTQRGAQCITKRTRSGEQKAGIDLEKPRHIRQAGIRLGWAALVLQTKIKEARDLSGFKTLRYDGPCWIRTGDSLLKRQILYLLS